MSIITTDVVAEHGAVYKKGGQGVRDIIGQIFTGSVTEQHMTMIPTDKTVVDRSSSEIARILQQYQKDWTPIGDITLKPRKIDLTKLKVDAEEVPDDIEQDWHGFLASNKLSRKEWPFTKWWLQELLLKKLLEDWELTEIYLGEKSAIVPGTATSVQRSVNGFRYLINNGSTNTVVLGAIPATDVLFAEYVQDFVAAIPRKERRKMDKIFMSEDLADSYKRGMREKYNANYLAVSDADLMKVKDNSNLTVVGLPSMEGDRKIWTTMKWNRPVFTKKPENEQVFKVEELKRNVFAHTDFYKGPGFWVDEYVYANDLDTVNAF